MPSFPWDRPDLVSDDRVLLCYVASPIPRADTDTIPRAVRTSSRQVRTQFDGIVRWREGERLRRAEGCVDGTRLTRFVPCRPTVLQQAAAPAAAEELSTSMKAMQKFAEKYCELTDTFFCSDLDITATVIKGKWHTSFMILSRIRLTHAKIGFPHLLRADDVECICWILVDILEGTSTHSIVPCYTRDMAAYAWACNECRPGEAQGGARRTTMPLPTLRGQGRGSEPGLLELPLRANEGAEGVPLHALPQPGHRVRRREAGDPGSAACRAPEAGDDLI